MALADLRESLNINPRNSKAWFRSANALLTLDKAAEAHICVDNALRLDPSHAQIQTLANKIKVRQSHQEKIKLASAERNKLAKHRSFLLDAALKARKISVTTTSEPPELPEGVGIKLENPENPASLLYFPTIFLYQPSMKSDFITSFPENVSLEQQLKEVLSIPPEWDSEQDFMAKNVECYLETKTGGLVKMGKRVALAVALGGDNIEVQDGLVRIMVVPRGKKAQEFIAGWKQRAKARRSE